MKIRVKKTWVAVLGLTLALSTVGGVALGAGADDWYDGDNATVADPDKSAVALKLYDAAGNQVTTGSTTTPIAAFAAADATVRADDAYASLFVHLPQTSTAQGAWPGVQVSGTDKFSGDGAVTPAPGLNGKPFVRTTAAGYTLADVKAAFPNPESSPSFAGVYELRLRTSSATKGVSTAYAAAYVKVTGTTWQVTTAPILGSDPNPQLQPVATSVAVAWPAFAYGRAAAVGATVTAASGAAKPSGSVRLVLGAQTLATATLTAAGTATLPVGATALAPGAHSLKVVYAGVPNAFVASESVAATVTVAKAAGPKPVLKVTKKPTRKKAGKATITVAAPAGLVKAGGKATVVLTKGKAVKKVVVTIKAGKATVKLPKLPKGTWKVRVDYAGDASYLPAKSKTAKVKSK
ncbi:Ig-like domain repeat protein [Nocardioides sp. W7]|uniref:Ig-like domain repeat protein n=1 Tax=Nocardioides sp. W7 TaxID=2931390 RepID=UPI001FD04C33|nr:Ig-like domain repeat protein [Nocardioides sp. W7]